MDVQPNTGAARTTTISVNDQNVILNQSACDYTISQPLLWNALAQSTFLNVSTAPGCSWTISSNAAWLQIGVPSTTLMNGPASVPVTIEQNTTSSLRAAVVTVGGRTVSLTQSASDCSLTASSANPVFPSGGGNGTIQVNATTCTAFLNLNAVGQSSSAPVTGQGQFDFTVPANTSSLPRGFLAQVGSGLRTLTLPFLQEGVNTPQPFTDVSPGSTFFNHISILKNRNVTRGCTFDGQQYCPSNTVTRADMALFLARAMNLQSASPNIPYFDDVPPTHPAFLAIQAIRAAGITLGCSSVPALYCPDQPLTRAQMAALIIRAKQGSDYFTYVSTPYFTDVPTSHIFFRHIQYLRDIGVTLGCTTTTFCPDSPNTRGEMSAFIVRAFLSSQ